jgi:hypothetical protein
MTDRRLTPSCPHEDDVLQLVSIGQWPERADAALVAHAASCPVCADLAIAASAMIELRDDEAAAVAVPDASLVWYRAQMRARADAARQATRPVFVAQIAAAACLGVIAVIWVSSGATGLSTFWQWLVNLVPALPTWSASTASVDTTVTGTWTAGRLIAVALIATVIAALIAVGISLAADGHDDRPRRAHRAA